MDPWNFAKCAGFASTLLLKVWPIVPEIGDNIGSYRIYSPGNAFFIMTAIPDDRPALITLPEVTGSRRATTIMSEFAQRDGFDVALSELERLIDIWGDLSATRAKKLGLSDLVVQRVKALMSPYMSTPYAMTAEAVGRLAALRKRSTDLNIRDLCFHGNFETLVVAMIKERAACQLGA